MHHYLDAGIHFVFSLRNLNIYVQGTQGHEDLDHEECFQYGQLEGRYHNVRSGESM